LYPTWFAEGFFLVRDPDVAYALARAYNDWVLDFCKAAPARLLAAAILPLQNWRNWSGWRGCRRSARFSSGPCLSRTAT
jgi:hypothetical protein